MPEENISPEERLFRVMQKEKEASAVAQGSPKPAGTSAKGSFFQKVGQLLPKGGAKGAAGAPKTPAAGTLDPLQGLKQLFIDGIDLGAVNRASMLILVALVACGVVLFTDQNPSIKKLMETISRIKFEKFKTRGAEGFQPMDYYVSRVRTRDIFSLPEEVEKQVVEQPEPLPAPPPPKPQLRDLAKGLKIVGIAWGDTPKAMIQDGATQEVYFLREGELVGKTEIQVKQILRDKVVISYAGEEMDL